MHLKRVLKDLSHELVKRHGYEPVALPAEFVQKVQEDKSNGFIETLIDWLDANPKAQKILGEMGIKWH